MQSTPGITIRKQYSLYLTNCTPQFKCQPIASVLNPCADFQFRGVPATIACLQNSTAVARIRAAITTIPETGTYAV